MAGATEDRDLQKAASKAIGIIEEFRKFDSKITQGTILTFLCVVEKDGINMKQVEKRTGDARSTISNNVAILSSIGLKRNGTKSKGMGLLDMEEDPEDRKQKKLYLTARGRTVANTIKEIVSK